MARPDATAKLKATQHKEGPSKILIGGIIAAVAIIALVVGVILANQSSNSDTKTPVAAGDLLLSGDTYVDGKPIIEIFEDPQCSACIKTESLLGKQIAERAKQGDFNVVVRPMTFQEPKFENTDSSDAVNAFYCAKDAGAFPEYHEAFYAKQAAGKFATAKGMDSWTAQDLVNLAAEVGVASDKLPAFTECVNKATYAEDVKKGEEWAQTRISHGTPEIWVNGELMDHGKVIDEAGSEDATAIVNALFSKAGEMAGIDVTNPEPSAPPATGTQTGSGTQTAPAATSQATSPTS